ncbi:hypothetical protein [Methylocystis sp.]|uniref:hypothetical protein n=1 Tax=Methylocystis sp. TaxID=1911079 RepID=UPI003DA49C38
MTTHAFLHSQQTKRHWGGPVVGGFFLSMGGVHLGIATSDPSTYQHFADDALFAFVRDGWQDVFMAHPTFFGLLLMAAETTAGILLLLGGRFATVGWAAVAVFHVLLGLFSFGIWVWCVPALVLIGYLARRDTTTRWGRARHLGGGDVRPVQLRSAAAPR